MATDVLKESHWSVDVERSITGLREAADALAAAGVPADAEVSASTVGNWLHIEATWLYLPDDEDGESVDAPSPVAGARR